MVATPLEARRWEAAHDALLDCGPDDLAARRAQREADRKQREADRRLHRWQSLSPANKAKLEARRAAAADADHADWRRAVDAAEADWDAIERRWDQACLHGGDDEAEAAFDTYQSEIAEWHLQNDALFLPRKPMTNVLKFPAATVPTVPPFAIPATPFRWVPPASIPRREWLYGQFLIRRQVALTVAPGGTGKSSLAAVEALAMATGLPLLHDKPTDKLRVWLWNGEDPEDELQRRITAAMLHHRIAPEMIGNRLFVDSGRKSKIIIAEGDRNGVVIARPVADALIATIRNHKIDVLVIDPFISAHRVSENDNGAIDAVAKEFADIADKTGCAVHLVHHSKKTGGEAVQIEDSRGAVALIAAARSARTLNAMTEKEATAAGVENRFRFVRIDDGKANLAPRGERSHWIKIESQFLGNDPIGLTGDSVAVATPWQWPDHAAGATADDVRKAQEAIAGGRWRESIQARDWAGVAIAKALGLDITKPHEKARVRALLRNWTDSGYFVVVMKKDDKGNDRPHVEIGEIPHLEK